MAERRNTRGSDQGTTVNPETAPQLNGVDPTTGLLKTGEHGRAWWGLVIVGWMAMSVFAFHACTRMVAAGDTWVAMACGRHFVNHGVDTVEPFSANSHRAGPTEEEVKTWPQWAQTITEKVGLETVKKWHPTGWVNQNWLTHMIFYTLTTTLGSEEVPYYDALVFWKFSLYFLTMVSIYAIGRQLGAHPALAAAATCFALFIGRSFLDIRPAGYSNLLVPVLVLILVLTTYRHYLFIWLIAPVAVFWGGAHGGYIYIFIVLVPFIGLHILSAIPKRWTCWLYSFLGWIALAVLCLKLGKHPGVPEISLGAKELSLLILLGGVGLALAFMITIKEQHVYLYHLIASGLIFIIFLSKLFPEISYVVAGRQLEQVKDHLTAARMTFFGLFVLFLGLGAVQIFAKNYLVSVPHKTWIHMVAAYMVTLIAAIVFNPFHLTNITHTFVVSVSEHAKRWRDVHEWHRAFDWDNPVGTAVPFLVMYILAWLLLLGWLVLRFMVNEKGGGASRSKSTDAVEARPYKSPLFDLPMIFLVGLTIYMAIRSRRFIPIAAFAACPILAMLLQQILNAIGAMMERQRSGRLTIPRLSRMNQQWIAAGSLLVVIVLGGFWGLKFKSIYLDPWPGDHEYDSVFMRMTASYLKPFKACQFMRLNKLEGNMLNYWTEGGAIGFGQDADPNTGKTPLQLFMDGRAQAAYDRKTFDQWSIIWAGGPKGYEIRRRGTEAKAEDWKEVGEWLDKVLKGREVWVALVPSKEWKSYFMRGLERTGNWRVVFQNNKQKMLIDIEDPRGRKLYNGTIALGDEPATTLYPEPFSENVSLGHIKMSYGTNETIRREGLQHALKAFEILPSPAAVELLVRWVNRVPGDLPAIVKVAQDYVSDFEEKQGEYRNISGYQKRLDAAWRLTQLLMTYEGRRKNNDAYKALTKSKEAFEEEFFTIGRSKKW